MNGLITIAHRAGNDLSAARQALDSGVHLVEADVHLFRGRLEMRHHKSLGPWFLWDAGRLERRGRVVVPELRRLIEAIDGDHRLMLDLKGVHPWLAGRVARTLHELAPGTPFTVCTQHWWMVRAFRSYPQVRVVLSAGSRRGLRRLFRRLHGSGLHGSRRLCDSPVYGVSVNRPLLTPATVSRLRNAVDVVMTWPVDTPDGLAHARHLGVGGVISKNAALLDDVLAVDI